jgi:hypothetical protein
MNKEPRTVARITIIMGVCSIGSAIEEVIKTLSGSGTLPNNVEHVCESLDNSFDCASHRTAVLLQTNNSDDNVTLKSVHW